MKEGFGMLNSAQVEAEKLIKKIENFWNKEVSDIQITDLTNSPFDMFTLYIKLYGKYEVKLYDRSTLGINLKVKDQFIGLSRLTKEPVFKGFDGYKSENLLSNFKVLDKTVKEVVDE